MVNNNDLIEPLRNLEYLLRKGVIFSESEKTEISCICFQITKHIEEE